VWLLCGGLARAGGPFCDDEHGETKLAALERYAHGRRWKQDDYFFACFREVFSDEYTLPDKPRARVLAACELAVALPQDKFDATPDAYCVEMLTRNGKSKVGSRDFVAETISGGEAFARERDRTGKMDSPSARGLAETLEMVARTRDPRARVFVLAQFEGYRAWWRKQKVHPKNWETFTDLEYQEIALLHALEQVGTHEDVALIDELGVEHGDASNWRRLVQRARDAAKSR
jgi:hypothetical protein